MVWGTVFNAKSSSFKSCISKIKIKIKVIKKRCKNLYPISVVKS